MPLFESNVYRGAMRLLVVSLILLTVALTSASPGLAQTARGPSSETPPPLDERDVEAFMDGYVGHQLEDYGIPGATVSVVKDGEVIFAKGYGRGRRPGRRACRRRRDALQDRLHEQALHRDRGDAARRGGEARPRQGRQRLPRRHDDTRHLPRPARYAAPPSHAHGGLRGELHGHPGTRRGRRGPLGEHLSENVPARVRPPGEVTSYSNYGVALAGHVVEEISGVPLRPLRRGERLRSPRYEEHDVRPAARPRARAEGATGYDVEGGDRSRAVRLHARGARRFREHDLDGHGTLHDRPPPGRELRRDAHPRCRHGAADARAAVRQRSRPGRRDGPPVLRADHERRADDPARRQPDPSSTRSSPAAERNVGVFVAYNSYGEGGDFAEYELHGRLYRPLLPGGAAGTTRTLGRRRRRERRALRRELPYHPREQHRLREGGPRLMTGARVTANPDGSLTTNGGYLSADPEETEQRWIRVAPANAPATFRAEEGDERIAFRESGSGDATYLAGDCGPDVGLREAAFLRGTQAAPRPAGRQRRRPAPLGPGMGGRGCGHLVEREAGPKAPREPAGERKTNRNASPGAARGLRRRRARPDSSRSGCRWSSRTPCRSLAWAPRRCWSAPSPCRSRSAVLTVGVLVYAALAWARGFWGLLGRVQYSLVALSALTFVALLGYYNLIGFQF